MRNQLIAVCGVALTALGLTACTTESASHYKTSDLKVSINVDTGETGSKPTVLSVSFNRKDGAINNFVQLTADDMLEANVGGTIRMLEEKSGAGSVYYVAGFDEAAADTEVKVSLRRRVEEGAPNSTVTLPSEFTLQPLAEERSSRAQPLVISWSGGASPEPTRIQISGDCFESHTAYFAEVSSSATSHTVPAGALKLRAQAANGQAVPEECVASVQVSRERWGTVDPAFHGGGISAERIARLTFTSIP